MDAENYNKLTQEELVAQLTVAKRHIDELERAKRRVGLSFRRVPESGYQISRLYNGDFPYFQHVPSLSYTLADRHADETKAAKALSESTDGNITLIEGDNLPVLAALQLTHKGRVDVIYIDPPYNTGNNDFIYNDARKSSIADIEGANAEDYETTLDGKARTVGRDDPERHSLWLSFMEKRLYLAKELLSETGVIFVSIDDNEQARLKLLMDEVFGEQNFVALLPVINNLKGNNDQIGFAGTHEYCIVYAKAKLTMGLGGIPLSIEQVNGYNLKDSVGSYKKGANLVATGANGPRNKRPNLFYSVFVSPDLKIIAPTRLSIDYIEILPLDSKKSEMSWRWGKEKMFSSPNELIISRQKNGKIDIFKKQRLEGENASVKPKSLFMKPSYSGTSASNEVRSLLGDLFSYPKSVTLIKDLISMVLKKDAIVLDFFAGSGTTGHAVAELNREDGGNRQCILVTHGDENGKNIAEDVTAKRIKRVLSGKDWADGKEHDSLSGEFNYYKLAFAPKAKNAMAAVETMQSKFVGFAALQQDVVLSTKYARNSNYAVLESSSKVVVVVKNEEYLLDEIDEFYNFLESLKAETSVEDVNKELIAYSPSETLEDSYSFASYGWKNISFPIEYLEAHAKLIDRMKKNQTLLPTLSDEVAQNVNDEKEETK